VEILNLRVRGRGKDKGEPVHLRDPYHVADEAVPAQTPPLGAGPATSAE
jgi:hypothetical protein